jgi:acyl-CoA hydrolase
MVTKEMPGSTVQSSAVNDLTYKVFPNDLNARGTIFGGILMSIIDRTALVVAERHARNSCVTVSIDSIHFLAPATRGDTLLFSAAVNRSWQSSMEIGVRVCTEDLKTHAVKHILTAYTTFVAVGDDGKAINVPPVIPETETQKRRFWEAGERRKLRREEAEQRRKLAERED